MEILGLMPYQITIIIVIIGVTFHIVLGFLKSNEGVNPRKIASSAIIATISGLIIIGPQVSILPNDLPDEIMLSSLVALIAAVAGLDALTKKVVQIEKNKKNSLVNIDLEIQSLTAKKEQLAAKIAEENKIKTKNYSSCRIWSFHSHSICINASKSR